MDCPFYDENSILCDDGECHCCPHYVPPPPPKPKYKVGDVIKNHYGNVVKIEEVGKHMYRCSKEDSLWDDWKDIEFVDYYYKKI